MLAHPFLKKDFEAREQFLKERRGIERLVDSTLLKPDYLAQDIKDICEKALTLQVRAVCLPPAAIELAGSFLTARGSPVCSEHSDDGSPSGPIHLCTVVGFPLGYQTTEVKCYEIKKALDKGANEIDFVQNISFIKDKAFGHAFQEMRAIVDASQNAIIKVIIETSLLSREEIIQCCEISFEAGVHIVKTSTGFGARGASVEDIELIATTLYSLEKRHKRRLGIKASGGIRTGEFATALIEAGASRIGTSQAGLLISELSNP